MALPDMQISLEDFYYFLILPNQTLFNIFSTRIYKDEKRL